MSEPLARSLHSASAAPSWRAPTTSPLHSASVHVTDVSYLANPAPVGCRGEGGRDREEGFGEKYLSPTRLRELTGESDLHKVTFLQISVDSFTGTIGNFGSTLPRLTELRCVESVVPCVRDLGTGLGQLVVLCLSNCCLRDLDGLPGLSSLQELYISHNEVSDVSVAAMLPDLRVLDLASNQLSEQDQLGYLGLCGKLSSLSLSDNPLTSLLSSREGGEAGYRAVVVKAVPQLTVLDDVPVGVVTPPPRGVLSSRSVWEFGSRQRQLQYSGVPARPRTAVSPGELGCVSPLEDGSSELTHGMDEVMCGNPVRALKARRKRGLSSQSSVASVSPTWSLATPTHHSPSPLYSVAEEPYVTMATSIVDLEQRTEGLTLSPSPPPLSLPTPPSSRPHSALDDFRHRRFRKPSPSRSRSASQERLDPHHPHHTTHNIHTSP